MIKGKYFPKRGFSYGYKKEEKFRNMACDAAGRDILRKGIIKRIGLGDMIDIWNDNWIQGIPSLKPRVRLEEADVM